MRHLASPEFWAAFRALPLQTRELARKNFELLKADPRHPSLHFEKIGKFRAVRVGLRFRALGVEVETGILWFWIGNHADYDELFKKI